MFRLGDAILVLQQDTKRLPSTAAWNRLSGDLSEQYTIKTSCAKTLHPTLKPTKAPTTKPTKAPTKDPTKSPTKKPTTVSAKVMNHYELSLF